MQQLPPTSLLMNYNMPRSLATYIVQLDVEFCQANDSVPDITKRNAWYSWRMDWVREFMRVFKLSTADIAMYLDDEISQAGLDSGKHNGKQMKDRCVAFCRAGDF